MKFIAAIFSFIISLIIIGCADDAAQSPSAKYYPYPSDNNSTTSNSSFTNTAAPVLNPLQQSSNTSSNAAVNPAHGQPGHRCDIAVGAPLNSAPVTTNNTVPVTNQISQPATSTATSTYGLNPSHGQPGHRCDIAVGASLNSKPVMPQSNNSISTITTPATNNVISNAGNGLNPSHGQPGHRCDIAVGAPLTTSPTPIKPSISPTITPFGKTITTDTTSIKNIAPASSSTDSLPVKP